MSGDLDVNLRQDFDTQLRSEDRVSAIMEEPGLRAWMATSESSVLFINGNHAASEHQPPTSFVCAKLVSTVRSEQQQQQDNNGPSAKPLVLALSHFCARHKHPKSTDAGPAGMLRSLLAQLLNAWPDFDLAIIERLRNIDHTDVDDLEHIFETLIDQVPAGIVVFCILDSITIMEDRQAWKEDAARVVKALMRLADRHHVESHCVLKLLMTSPTISRTLYRQIPDRNVVWMPDKVPRLGPSCDYAWKHEVAPELRASSRSVSQFLAVGQEYLSESE